MWVALGGPHLGLIQGRQEGSLKRLCTLSILYKLVVVERHTRPDEKEPTLSRSTSGIIGLMKKELAVGCLNVYNEPQSFPFA